MTESPGELEALLNQLATLASRMRELSLQLEKGKTEEDYRWAVGMMLTDRAAEIGDAVVTEVAFGRSVAGGILIRALLETAWGMRWSMRSATDAKRWWKMGDLQIQKTVKGLNLPDRGDPNVRRVKTSKVVVDHVPGPVGMAQQAGLRASHDTWYPMLSAYAHGCRSSTLHGFGRGGETAPPHVLVALAVECMVDVGNVGHAWAMGLPVPQPGPVLMGQWPRA